MYKTANRVFLIEDGERHWVVSDDVGVALDKYAESSGFYNPLQAIDEHGGVTVSIVDPRIKLKITDDDGCQEMTAAEWAEVSETGVLCSTVE